MRRTEKAARAEATALDRLLLRRDLVAIRPCVGVAERAFEEGRLNNQPGAMTANVAISINRHGCLSSPHLGVCSAPGSTARRARSCSQPVESRLEVCIAVGFAGRNPRYGESITNNHQPTRTQTCTAMASLGYNAQKKRLATARAVDGVSGLRQTRPLMAR